MGQVLPKLISREQACFMPGRGVSDQVLLAKEMVHILNKSKRGGRIIIKLDMAKAFDRVSWDYLCRLLLCMRFSPLMRSYLMSWWLKSSNRIMLGNLKVVITHLICWNIWKEYTAITIGDETFNHQRLEERIHMDIYTWCAAASGKKYAASIPSLISAHLSPTIRTARAKVVRWLTPPPGRQKINVDAAAGRQSAAAGAIVRDSQGRLLSAISFPLPCLSPLHAELQAALYVTIFYATRYHGFILETDCLELINMLDKGHSVMGVMRVDLDWLRMFLHLTRSTWKYTPRETNSVAHHLASMGLTVTSLLEYKHQNRLPPIARGCYSTDLHTPYLRF